MKEKLTKEIIKDQVTKWMEEGIQSVITGKEKNAELLYCRPNNIIEYVQSIGGTWNEDLDTNGCQWDYWIKLEIKGKTYIASGDGYYGCCASFELNTDDDI